MAAPMVAGANARADSSEIVGEPGDRALIERLETYLNDIETLRSGFIQVAPDGAVARGTVRIERPGRLRIEYVELPVLIVSNGPWMTYYDKELREASYVRTSETLAGFLVRDTIRLNDDDSDVRIRNAERNSGVIRLTLERKAEPEAGSLTLVFNANPIMLRQWVVMDGAGSETRVALVDPAFNVPIDDAAFDFTPPESAVGPRSGD